MPGYKDKIIAVWGSPHSGKTTLSLKLGQALGLSAAGEHGCSHHNRQNFAKAFSGHGLYLRIFDAFIIKSSETAVKIYTVSVYILWVGR